MTVEVSVIIPTYRRLSAIRRTLQNIALCDPQPAEILVHIDAGDTETAAMLSSSFPHVRQICSDSHQGPGGGRNKLVTAATHEVLVSLDDDSWPTDPDFFGKAEKLCVQYPTAGVIACSIEERGDPIQSSVPGPYNSFSDGASSLSQLTDLVDHFVGCGAVLRRSAFLKTAGYLPLRYAYGMEEVDVSLQLLDAGYQIRQCSELRVYHDCDRDIHHANPRINAAQISNTALLAFLRYPIRMWPYGILQVINRVRFSLRRKRRAGIMTGLFRIPVLCWQYRRERRPVSTATVRLRRRLSKATGN